jgi:hypothetical protein
MWDVSVAFVLLRDAQDRQAMGLKPLDVSEGDAAMTSDKAYYALALAAALVSITAQTAAAWDSRKECVDFYKAEAGSKNLVCDQKKGNAHQDCVEGVASWLEKSLAGCP